MLAHIGMLSWSAAETGQPVEVAALTDPERDPGLPGGDVLLGFVDAVLGGADLSAAREALVQRLGPGGLVNAASVVANFQMMNRIADGTGMPVGKGARLRNADLIVRLGLDRFDHLTPPAS